ncbi:AraC family transcriptional regulator [Companilactobacillus insicii]|uniref:AraC family transcriptional regulator n=1 Tax=Companilactobacillus insicii TaxID=1732567 RepID=UPI000F78FDF2|nr:AraC family transcriptional regulator [Companilactobacillus insicii]
MLKEFNQLMDYIEEHLTEKILDDDISKIVGMSSYHFKRMFSYLANMSFYEYIKNRRLSSANRELISGSRVTDVAYKYGYQSIDGFARAFKEWSGFLPSDVMKNKIQKEVPKFVFFIDIKGGIPMEYKIKSMPKFNIVGVSRKIPMQFKGENNSILELAKSITAEQRDEMHQLADMDLNHPLNVSYDFDDSYPEKEGSLTHMIGMATTEENIFDDLEEIVVPDSKWAVFYVTGEFPQAMQDVTGRIYSEWLPSTDFKIRDIPSFSFTIFKDEQQSAYSEIWTPIL